MYPCQSVKSVAKLFTQSKSHVRLVIVTIDQRNVALKNEDARRVSSFNFMNRNMSIRQYMSNTCTRRPARIHYLNYATSVLPHAQAASLATNIDPIDRESQEIYFFVHF